MELVTTFSSENIPTLYSTSKNILYTTQEDILNGKIEKANLYLIQDTNNPFMNNLIFFSILRYMETINYNSRIIFPTKTEQDKEFWQGYLSNKHIRELKCEIENYSEGQFINFVFDKIVVCSVAIGEEYKKAVEKGMLSRKMYCIQNDYIYKDEENYNVYDSSRPPAWSKVQMILKCLKEAKADYVIWMDADTIIMDFNHRIEDIILQQSAKKDIIICKDNLDLNTGVMIVKNTEWSINFFEKLWQAEEFTHADNWEQDAFIYFYDNNICNCVNNIVVLKQKSLNTFWYQYERGDFILHFAGCTRMKGISHLQKMMEFYCPFRDSKEKYKFYTRRVKKYEETSKESQTANKKVEKERQEDIYLALARERYLSSRHIVPYDPPLIFPSS